MFKIETTRVKGDAWKARDAAEDFVKSQGPYDEIGSGSYATVYGANDSDVVYKVGLLLDNEGYLSYLEELRKMKQHNPFTPRIYEFRKYRATNTGKGGPGAFVVAMERLRADSRVEEDPLAAWFMIEIMDQEGTFLDRWPTQHELEVINILQDAERRCMEAEWDLHSENFMYRGDQIVITDPLG